MADDRTGLLSTGRPTPPPQSPTPTPTSTSPGPTKNTALYHDSSQSPNARLIQVLYLILVAIMLLITMCLAIYKAVEHGATYLMLGICILGFGVVELLLIFFTRRGDLPKGKTWFLYFVGFCIILESIFTDVLLFQ